MVGIRAKARPLPPPAPPAPPAITSITTVVSLSHDVDAVENDYVGTVGNDLGVEATYSIDNTKYKLSPADGVGTTVDILIAAAGAGNFTAGTESIEFTTDPDNGTTPCVESKSVSVVDVGEDLPLAILTVTETSGGTKTNEIIEFGFALAAGDMDGYDYLKLYEADVNGDPADAVAAYWFDLPSADVNGDKRHFWGGLIEPSLAGNATVKYVICASNSAPPTSNPITAANLLATDFRVVDNFDFAGTVYSFDTDDALAASDTFSKTDYQCVVASQNSHCTILQVSGPPKNSGTAHLSGEGMRSFMEIRAFKVGAGAVSGGNPITLGWADVWAENGDIERASPTNLYYGMETERAADLDDATLISTDDADADGNDIRYVYATSQPAATLTATGATTTGNKTWTIGSGSWAADIKGAHIGAGGGLAFVTGRTNDTTITVRVYKTFDATSYTSGNWTVYGIGHQNHIMRPPRRVWIGNKPTNIAIVGDVDSAATPTSRAPLDYLASTGLLPNFQMTHAEVTHSTGALDNMKGDGCLRPMTFIGPEGTDVGDVETDIGGTGWNGNIGIVPEYMVAGLAKYTAAGRRKIFENGEHLSTHQNCPRRYSGSPTNGQLGVVPQPNCGVQYGYNHAFAFSSRDIQFAANNWSPWDGDKSHTPHCVYIPYLLQPSLYRLRFLQGWMLDSNWNNLNPDYNGSNENKTILGDALGVRGRFMGSSTDRQKAWTIVDLVQATICTPDSLSEKIAASKSSLLAYVAKTWDAGKAYGPDDVLSVSSGTPPDSTPQWGGPNSGFAVIDLYTGTESLTCPFMQSFFGVAMSHAAELGMLDADGNTFREWLLRGALARSDNTGSSVPQVLTRQYWVFAMAGATAFTSWPTDWAEIYRRDCILGPIITNTAGRYRVPSGSVTLSAASVGTGRTMTFANDYFSGGGSWYQDGYIVEGALGGASGRFKITGVSLDGLTITGDIEVAFAGTTLTAANVKIPGPHRLDYNGEYDTITSVNSSSDYTQFHVANLRMMRPDFPDDQTDIDAAITMATGLTGYTEIRSNFNVAARS